MADILGSDAKCKLLFTGHNALKHSSGALFVKHMLIYFFYKYGYNNEKYIVKKIPLKIAVNFSERLE